MTQQTYHVYDGSAYVGRWVATPAQMQPILTANGWTTGAAPTFAPAPLDVIEERNRRIIAGTTINVTGHGDVQLAGDAQTRSDLQALVTIAQMRLAASDTTTLRVRGKDGTIHTMTPAQVVELWAKGVAFIQSVIDASWAIEAMTPIPSDYATRSEWP